MAAPQFHHFGVPTYQKHEGETYIEAAKVFATSPDDSPFRIEFLRFEQGSPMAEAVQTRAHAAFMVDDLSKAIEGKDIIVEPFDAMPTLRVAFILDGDAVIEVMQEI